MQNVRLVPLTPSYRDRFVEEEFANYGDEQVRDSGWEPDETLERARMELGPTLERELSEAAERGQKLWTALNPAGDPVGWLWVTPVDDEPGTTAFLYQIPVAADERRRGYGRAMLSTLEDVLAARDSASCVSMSRAQTSQRRRYAASGYELFEQDERRCGMRKTLKPSS